MNKNLGTRTLLYDKSNNRYIKAIDQRDFESYIDLLSKDRTRNTISINEFRPIINQIHTEISNLLTKRDSDNLKSRHSSMFNNWTRLKSFTNEDLKCKASLTVMNESENVMTWIHTQLPDLVHQLRDHIWNGSSDDLINKITSNITLMSDVFIESMLCNIHATVLVDSKSLLLDTVLNMHINTLHELLKDLLREISGLAPNGDSLLINNIIEQSCMENTGINADALLSIVGSEKTSNDIINGILSSATIETFTNNREQKKARTITWTVAPNNKLNIAKRVLLQLQKTQSVIYLLNTIDSYNFNFDGSDESENDILNEVNQLISNNTSKA